MGHLSAKMNGAVAQAGAQSQTQRPNPFGGLSKTGQTQRNSRPEFFNRPPRWLPKPFNSRFFWAHYADPRNYGFRQFGRQPPTEDPDWPYHMLPPERWP